MKFKNIYIIGLLVMFFGFGVITAMAWPIEPITSEQFHDVLPMWILACALLIVGVMFTLIIKDVNDNVNNELERRARKEQESGE